MFWKIYGWPIILALFSIVGLLSALLGDDIWDALSWIALTVPLVIILRHQIRAAGS